MNNKIKEKAEDLNEWLLNQDIIKEYKYYEDQILQDNELKSLEEELKQLQKEIVIKKHNNIDCEDIINDYQSKKDYFDNHPLVSNYLSLKQEVNELLHYIQEDINEQLKKMVD